MNAQFTFPPPQAPTPRPGPGHKSGETAQTNSRESNGLRASVLDAALELGLVSNPLVADWMFNNTLAEEDEGEDQISSPGLTYGSSATSEESSSSALSPSSSAYSSSSSSKLPNAYGAGAQFPANKSTYGIPIRKDGVIRIVEPDIPDRHHDNSLGGNGVAFPEITIPPRPTTPAGGKKLKKKHRGDGYESDGGYMSEAGKKKEKKEKKEKKKAESKDGEDIAAVETEKEAKKRAKEEKKEQEQERKRAKSLLSAAKTSKKAETKEAAQFNGYDTDGGAISGSTSLGKSKSKKSKSKTPSSDTPGYETDGAGYQSSTPKKSKSRFFKLSSKASKPEFHAEAVPPLPSAAQKEKEFVPLPIAGRFATTLSPDFFGPASPSEGRNTPIPTVSLPPPSESTNLLTPLPFLSFQPFTSSTSRAASPIASSRTNVISPAPINRDSHASTESSTSSSSHSRRLHAHSSVRDSSGGGHGNGSGSYSTITSSSMHQHQTQPPPTQLAPSTQYNPTTNRILSPTPSTSSGHSAGSKSSSASLKPPPIAFPNSRSPSLKRPATSDSTPPVAPLQIMKGLKLKASLDNLLSSRNASPSPISPGSFVMVPSNGASPTATSPTLGIPSSPSGLHPPSLSPSPIPGRPRNPPADGFGPRSPVPRAIISPPNTAITPQAQKPTHLSIMPSSEYLVPSPRNSSFPSPSMSNLPSPNVLAYYDIPPPSPPPMGPLPNVPAGGPSASASAGQFPSAAALRQRVIDRTPRPIPPELSAALHGQSHIQRGKESPFPARPLIGIGSPAVTSVPGLEARVSARRYRELYANVGGALADLNRYQEEKDNAEERRRTRLARESTWVDDDERGDDDGQELHGVLDRFEDRSSESVESHSGRALERSHSFEAIKERHLAVNRDSEYHFDDGRTVGDRNSRWSGSIYSRASILDEDESGETRERLVKRVEAMLNDDAHKRDGPGGMGRGYIPPVPKLPDAYANMGVHVSAGVHSEATPGRSWNKF